MKTQPRIRGSSRPDFSPSAARSPVPSVRRFNSHLASRLFTPSIPSPMSGHPNPVATVGGSASGKDAAEKKVIDSIGGLFNGGVSILLACLNFSGIARKEDMLYLGQGLQMQERTLETREICSPIMGSYERVLTLPGKAELFAIGPGRRVDAQTLESILPAISISTEATEHDNFASDLAQRGYPVLEKPHVATPRTIEDFFVNQTGKFCYWGLRKIFLLDRHNYRLSGGRRCR